MSAAGFKSCVHPPLLDQPDGIRVIDVIPPMELHLSLGIVNRLYKELDAKLCELPSCSMRAEDWAKRLSIHQSPHHGGQFAGNCCSKLLQHVDLLQQMLQSSGGGAAMPVVHALRSFRDVQRTCFGARLLDGFEEAISEFTAAYQRLAIPISPKVHAVLDHVAPFLREQSAAPLGARGLGFWSEQASESVHADFLRVWTRGQKLPLGHPGYARQLLRCVAAYNARHQ